MRELLRCGVLSIWLLGTIGYGQGSDNGVKLSSKATSSASISTTSPHKTAPSAITPTLGNGTCPSRTANYITHTLPQQCLRTDRTASTSNATARVDNGAESTGSVPRSNDGPLVPDSGARQTSESPEHSAVSTTSVQSDTALATGVPFATSSATVIEIAEESDSPLDNANFLSFEEWKKQNLPKVDLDQGRYAHSTGDRQRPGISNALESLGEEGEIDLDFSGFGGSAQGPSQPRAAYRQPDGSSPQDVPTSQTIRSKDAGKTCKERTNYASFDCSAQVLKHNPECKSASSVLVENKDSYMLNTCSAQNRFFIVELCNDILVDTVVLANYEFFSSIFRQFRVSVSDRYPVKMDKWRELGTFEARNTREIQAFLVEHPQIWARYLRVEFLSHYGSEYYCPISLLRVHGTTMLEDIRPVEDISHVDNGEDDTVVEPESEASTLTTHGPVIQSGELSKGASSQSEVGSRGPSLETMTSKDATDFSSSDSALLDTTSLHDFPGQNSTVNIPTLPGPEPSEMTCSSQLTTKASGACTSYKGSNLNDTLSVPSSSRTTTTPQETGDLNSDATSNNTNTSTASTIDIGTGNTSTITIVTPHENATSATTIDTKAENISTSSPSAVTSPSTSANTRISQSNTSTETSRTHSATSSLPVPQSQPSTQESFFKSLSKRIQQLESNSTLSLQYIEEQSRILRDAFSKVEKRQISTTSNFLANLNETVMTELRGFRQAYDQLWQSTVLELEGQREQYQREMLAMSSRLTLVADELLWQKRMGIVQSSLLLLCLGLVLFARTGLQGYLEVPLMQQMMNKSSAALSRTGWESPPASPSPENRSPVALFRRKLWRSSTEPSALANGNITDGDVTGTDSRPPTRDGPNVDVFVEPPTPPSSRGVDGVTSEVYDDADADDEEDILNRRESQSGPSTPTGTREILDGTAKFGQSVINGGVG